MSNRLTRLQTRRVDETITNAKQLNEVYHRIEGSNSVKYALGAMQPIDPEYTVATYAEGDRVKNQLEKMLSIGCDYEYQGSVTNGTHIKAKSDIDLLTIRNNFVTLEPPQEASSPYNGDPLQDLKNLRHEEIKILRNVFPEATVDTTKSKCIAITGGSLRRDIDVVPSNWYDTNNYVATGNKSLRGVQVLDVDKNERIKNTPFLHNVRIEEKDSIVNGGLRKVARLMKSLKYDTETIDLSSYDIVSIAYNIESEYINVPQGGELVLLQSCCDYCARLLENDTLRLSLLVPDGHRNIFVQDHATKQGLIQLTSELVNLRDDVISENSRSFQKLAEARVMY